VGKKAKGRAEAGGAKSGPNERVWWGERCGTDSAGKWRWHFCFRASLGVMEASSRRLEGVLGAVLRVCRKYTGTSCMHVATRFRH